MEVLRALLPRISLPLARAWYLIRPGARILMYHRVTERESYDQLSVSPHNFEKQIHWLSQHRDIYPLSEVISSIRAGRVTASMVAITFDDGYLDNLECALPILEKYHVPATIFITSHFAAQKLIHPRYRGEDKRLHLNWREVRKLADHPLIEIGSHTVTHPMLSQISDADVLKEIKTSKEEIEKYTETEVHEFCYPAGNFTNREEKLVEQCGYSAAVTVKPGSNRINTGIYALRRTEITDRDTLRILEQKLDGAFDLFHYLLDIKRELVFSRQRQ